MSCRFWTTLLTWIILTTFWFLVYKRTLWPIKLLSKDWRANWIPTSCLQVEDLRDSSTDQVRWQTRLESWIKAQQPVEEASASKTLDGTNGTYQNSLPFQDFELSLQKKSPFFALSWTRTSEFHQRHGLMTTCKNLVIIWVTFPQLSASEVMNLT